MLRTSMLSIALLVTIFAAEIASGAAGIDSGISDPYTQKVFPKLHQVWGAAGFDRINKLRIAAAKKASESKRCDYVEVVELSEMRSTPTSNPVVFVDCRNGERFYMSESDVDKGPVQSQTQKGAAIGKAGAIQRCTTAVQRKLQFPSSMDSSWFGTTARQAPTTGNWVVEYEFTAKNGFGIELPAKARCIIEADDRTEVTISNR